MPPKKAPKDRKIQQKKVARRPKTQDDLSKIEREEMERREISKISQFLGIATQNQEYWLSASCRHLRAFCRHYEAHPEKFPMAYSDSPRVDNQIPSPEVAESRTAPALSKGFLTGISDHSKQEKKSQPVLQVVTFEIKYEARPNQKKVRRARLMLWDGGQEMCLGVLSTHLNEDASHQLASGQPIIRLKQFNVVQFWEGTSKPQTGVFVLQYQFLCRPLGKPVALSELNFLSPRNDTLSKPTETAEDCKPAATTENKPTSSFHHSIVAYQEAGEFEPLPSKCMQFCRHGARLCSLHGIVAHYCIAEYFLNKVNKVDFLEAASTGCPFVDRDVEKMSPNLRRNVLYWWFSTNVYFVKGAGNRKELPPCIVACIRMAWPNKAGDGWVGYKKCK